MEGQFSLDDPRAEDVRSLLMRHLEFTSAQSPPEDCHALSVDELAGDRIQFFSYRSGGSLQAVGALKSLDDDHAELKSMHTVEVARGRGIGAAMLAHLLAVARERGFARVSIETGVQPAFAPARALYQRAGFTACEPFGYYRPSPNSVFMTLSLLPTRAPAAR
jgi:putative acetyltransferase